tara:strand:- start:14 stop:1117 length:1104 start_codon:yes stop_codon:yes gene_type:complete
MKKLLYIFLSVSIIFSACKKEEEEPVNNNTGNTTVLTWEKTYFDGAGDQKGGAFCINQTSDGGYIFLSKSVTATHMIMKIDKYGDEQWSQLQYDDFNDFDYLAKTNDGGFIVAGMIDTATSHYNSRIHLLKLNEFGNQQWNTEINQSSGGVEYVSETNDGGYIISSNDTLVKTNSQGVLVWKKGIKQTVIFHTNDGGYIASDDDSLIKINSNGNIEWESHTFTNPLPSYYSFESIEQTNDGGYVLGGSVGNKTERELVLAKTDANGNVQWEKKFGGDSNGEIAKQTSDGGYIIVGDKTAVGGSKDVYFVKTDANGNQEMNKAFGGTDYDYGISVEQTSDGGYIIGAETESFGNDNIYIIKVDEYGNL